MDLGNSETNKHIKPLKWYGWVGFALIFVFWLINWFGSGARTYWAFFPLWLGYCLVVDAINAYRTGTSLIQRSWRKYISLFLISMPCWWLYEFLNQHVNSWHYLGRDLLNNWQYFLISSICFSIVVPAIFGSAELVSSFDFIKRMRSWIHINPDRKTTLAFFSSGLLMFVLLWIWPQYFFPFMWISIYFMIEPVNVWLGNRNLGEYTKEGDWRPVASLFLGALLTGIFWEMWNYYSYPKWIYTIPYVGVLHIFEMPLLGYGGYLPFACELFALYHLIMSFFKVKKNEYIHT